MNSSGDIGVSGRQRDEWQYRNTVTHEFGHIFGLDDGYPHDDFASDNTLRPRASMLEANDIMNNHLHRNSAATTFDIQMLILAASTGDWQYYESYLDNVQSLGALTYGACCDD